jgi:hypothetical protein
MDVIEALKRDEAKWLLQISAATQQLEITRAALKLYGKAGKKDGRKRRKMSAATRAKMKASAKARWAKVAKKE